MRLAGAFTWAFAASVLGADAFVPFGKVPLAFTTSLSSTTVKISEVPTTPIPGMKPGTSGLRKKVEVWQGKTGEKHYVENFIQSLLDTATANNGGQVPETYVNLVPCNCITGLISILFTYSVLLWQAMVDTLMTRQFKSFVVCSLPME
jgi:hypothetical protein